MICFLKATANLLDENSKSYFKLQKPIRLKTFQCKLDGQIIRQSIQTCL